jgi:uncharacterized protein YdhG (YjbR/CyaY superfamily)
MKTDKTTPKNIDEYIAGFPKDVQKILREIRTTIRKVAPRAEESISYRIPTFKLEGPLVYFAAFKSHIGMYPMTGATRKTFEKELSKYEGGKGTVRFPLDRPIPHALIGRIVRFKVKENAEKAKGRAKK